MLSIVINEMITTVVSTLNSPQEAPILEQGTSFGAHAMFIRLKKLSIHMPEYALALLAGDWVKHTCVRDAVILVGLSHFSNQLIVLLHMG